MPAAPTPDFRLYHSNALEVLAGLMAHALRTPAPGQSLLAPDVVLIPQVAMRRWLQATLAAEHGVAANLEFVTPGEFVGKALSANLGPPTDEPDAAALRWHLYAALTDPAFLAQTALAALRAHVDSNDPLRPWALAGELASVFEKYQAWRRDWLLRWEAGADTDDPQAILWRRIARGRQHRARRIQQYLDRFESPDAPLPVGLPPRLFAFATLNVSPDVLRVLATQARVGTLHFYVPSPSRDYWGDLQRVRAGGAEAARTENPLLQAWGHAGRDFMAVLGSYEVVHPDIELRSDADPGEGGGALHGSLLRRLQSDLFQRLPSPPLTPTAIDPRTRLPALRRDDPSLQVHACHTRLRELQVLHDQLRALFEDPRFDPPLQPRDVAVLAPDIDPYIPYLDAVFGGRGREGQAAHEHIPYALADASPLAGEPLADVFLRLLALPVARFGLEETLDLLASPPLAESAGLDAGAFARLHAWLFAAGARWGIDAAHRARLDAPADDAYTWAFALDRLLLGHASGSDAPIATASGHLIAPLPELEGSALDALDTLVRLLRVLARHADLLGEAMPPEAWRDRLLRLLDALLPKPPSAPATQRALDRLRSLIDAFAADATRAGFDAPVPSEAVRAHFAGVLGEADTRAPLLTGGVSVGRMVPMRLLPFRAICLLGMDDGDFPRRDSAAGLNRLTAELGTDRRQVGDRSTRDDDRFLFLQLFAAAQDVFYVSYQGADPRDGSVREPSVLVTELLAAADAQHAPDAHAADDLVVHHPLQPFAPAAFGAGDEPRRFSYRQQWWQAASQPVQRRIALPAWFDGTALPPIEEAEDALSLDTLRRFLQAPAETFLRQRLGMRLADVETLEGDVEPLLAPGRGLAKQQLQRAVFEARLRGDDDATTQALLRARGLLPSGPLGRRTLDAVRREVDGYAEAFRAWRGDAIAESPRIEADINVPGSGPGQAVRLHGRLGDVYPHGIARVRFDAPNGNSAIRDGLDWLLASAAGLETPLVQFHDGGDAGAGPHTRATLAPHEARALLAHLIALRAQGLRAPLPFAPYSGWELFNAPTLERGLQNAAKKWHGSDRSWGEGNTEALRLALRGRDPFTDAATQIAFVDQAMTVFGAVVKGLVYGGTDLDALRTIAAELDVEESE
ncbi:exodeoxyribonuclease V subunit gamma [Luteimonas deserti]|uniref:RecBCD enzyme subunit RecC n=1 Tax=Luteimonas deserti TaxID=2752306 RepID=A0A7Z0TZ83_9GAMM|nr:exodeoxyribonuclease V subunit gamma [Luteimonas deserti]NYZ61958.1 exodeoxyribonuclease V subunit gamma [Luteimonas deserti]